MIHDPVPPSRRDFLRTSLLAAGAVPTPSLHALAAGTHATGKTTYPLTPADRELFTTVLAKLRGLLADAMEKSKVEYGDGLRLHTPDVSGKYCGIWPDDFLFPTLAAWRQRAAGIRASSAWLDPCFQLIPDITRTLSIPSIMFSISPHSAG